MEKKAPLQAHLPGLGCLTARGVSSPGNIGRNGSTRFQHYSGDPACPLGSGLWFLPTCSAKEGGGFKSPAPKGTSQKEDEPIQLFSVWEHETCPLQPLILPSSWKDLGVNNTQYWKAAPLPRVVTYWSIQLSIIFMITNLRLFFLELVTLTSVYVALKRLIFNVLIYFVW